MCLIRTRGFGISKCALASLQGFAAARDGAYEVCVRSPLLARKDAMESAYNIAGIDVHKKMLAVVIANARDTELQFECRKFGTTVSELRHLSAWLQERGVQEAAMESTAQYWKPVWIAFSHRRMSLNEGRREG